MEQLIPFQKAKHPEAAIYEDFDAFDRDAQTMHYFHQANPTKKLELLNNFLDSRFRTFARRIIFDNYFEILTEEERAKFAKAIVNRLNHQDSEVPWITALKAVEETDKLLKERPELRAELEKIREFLKAHIF